MSAIQDLGGQGTPAVDEFEVWLGERNRWLQTAAKNLIETKRPPTDPEIVELARLCMIESKKADDPGFSVVAPGSLALAANHQPTAHSMWRVLKNSSAGREGEAARRPLST